MLKKLKLINRIKYVLALIYKPILKFKRKYIYKQHSIKKRLFSTTGNISLVNTLALLKQIDNTNCEDYLIINSGGNEKFWECNLELAKLHNFKKIIKISDIRYSTGFILSDLYDFDEIYTINHPMHLSIINEIYNDISINLIDEGMGSLINHKLINQKKLKNFYTTKYLNKLDGLGYTKEEFSKFKYIDVKNFNKISNAITKKYSIESQIVPNEKYILYCGIYWEVSGLDKNTFIKEQNKQINNLIDAGYKILYKPHPRDTEFYGLDKNPNIKFINTYLPVELYHWDILALTAMSCSTIIQLAHYDKVPCFSNILLESYNTDFDKDTKHGLIKYIIREYSPDYKLLLNLDVKNTSVNELKQQIKEIYNSYMAEKSLLSENETIKEFAKNYGID